MLAGLGLENKYSMAIFGFGIVAGLLLTGERRILFGGSPKGLAPHFWIGGLIAFLIFLPNLLWNIRHDFPFLELQRNIARSGRNVGFTFGSFLGQEILAMLPLSAPVWIAGLWHLFFDRDGRRFRALGWAWIITAAVIYFVNPRIYYLFPAFPLLFAAGSVSVEKWLARPRLAWVKWAYAPLMVLAGAALAPITLPILPPETYIRYATTLHIQQPRVENHQLGPLPQLFADQFGWDEMAGTVARVYNNLPPDVRARTAIFCNNYGQAGAIDMFGPKYGLPNAISGHQSYFLWGPRGYTGESVIVLGSRRERLTPLFASVEKVARVEHPYSMPYEHFDVFYCRGLTRPLSELWPEVKSWD